jgi:4-diphosphocytidyl-2-C-methyl-D-erythritol kinase
MYLRRGNFTWTDLAPAKLNLFLEVLGRRADGFHELETLMAPIRLFDTLRLTVAPAGADGEAGPINLKLRSGLPLRPPRYELPFPVDRKNLVVHALELLRERSGCTLGANVELVKRIPAAAGLGGGSSDAAAALRLANRAWGLEWPADQLEQLAAELGSDVPFFLKAGVAICRGRGERVEPIEGLPAMHFVVVKPPEGLSTVEVYRAHDALAGASVDWSSPESRTLRRMTEARLSNAWRGSYDWMLNRLESAAASLSPWIERLQAAFDGLGFLRHQLSGSGTAYFGVCRSASQARRLASVLKARQLGLVYATRSYG